MNLWFLLILAIPLLGVAYVSWHVWVLLPLANMWKATIIAASVVCFFMFFLDLSGTLDKLPLPLARVLYEIGYDLFFYEF